MGGNPISHGHHVLVIMNTRVPELRNVSMVSSTRRWGDNISFLQITIECGFTSSTLVSVPLSSFRQSHDLQHDKGVHVVLL